MKEKLQSFAKKNSEIILLFVFCCLTFSIYWQTVYFDFINLDDNVYVYDNPFVVMGLTKDSVYYAFTSILTSNWHPLTWLSHQLDVTLFGLNPGAHHLTNVLIHLINTYLAFVLFSKLTGSFWKSFVVAALFAVHPAHVESVAWISERKDVLSTSFWLLTMILYAYYLHKNGEKPEGDDGTQLVSFTARQKVMLAVMLALGLMIKPMLVTLPFALILLDYWPLNRLNSPADLKRVLTEKLPMFILVLGSCVMTVIAQRAGKAIQTLDQFPLALRLENAAVSYVKYIVTFFYPVNLGVWYPYDLEYPLWRTIAAVSILVVITFVFFRLRTNFRYLLVGWLWFVGILVPVIGFVQVGEQSHADRYTYVPYFGLLVIAVWGTADLLKFLKIKEFYGLIPAAAAIVVFSVICFGQVSLWRNNETLYTHSIAVTKNNFMLPQSLCHDLLTRNKLDEAEKQCKNALKYKPDLASAYGGLGAIHMKRAQFKEAAANYQKALELGPNFRVFRLNLGVSLSASGRPEEAEEHLKIVLSTVDVRNDPPFWASTLNDLALSYFKKKNYPKAEEYFKLAVEITPANPDFRKSLVLTLVEQEKVDLARQQMKVLVRQQPNDAAALVLFAQLLSKEKKYEEALDYLEKARSLRPDFPDIKENIEGLKTTIKKSN